MDAQFTCGHGDWSAAYLCGDAAFAHFGGTRGRASISTLTFFAPKRPSQVSRCPAALGAGTVGQARRRPFHRSRPQGLERWNGGTCPAALRALGLDAGQVAAGDTAIIPGVGDGWKLSPRPRGGVRGCGDGAFGHDSACARDRTASRVLAEGSAASPALPKRSDAASLAILLQERWSNSRPLCGVRWIRRRS
jgi:hypothetical protein